MNFGELLQNLIPIPIQHILSSVWEPPETDHTRRCQAGLQRGFDPTLSNDPKSNAQPLKFDPGRRICAPLRVGNPRHTGSGRRRRPDPQKILIGENIFYIAHRAHHTRRWVIHAICQKDSNQFCPQPALWAIPGRASHDAPRCNSTQNHYK